MKTIILGALCAAIISTVGYSSAATPPPVIKELAAEYKAGEIQADVIAMTATDNIKDYDFAGGIGVTYWQWENVGFGTELKTFNTADALVDLIGLNLAARYPIAKIGVAGFSKIGFDWDAEQTHGKSDFTVYIGLGIEKRFTVGPLKNCSVAGEVRGVRAAALAPEEKLEFLLRVGKTF
jgi:hypothetical protein